MESNMKKHMCMIDVVYLKLTQYYKLTIFQLKKELWLLGPNCLDFYPISSFTLTGKVILGP